MNAPPSLCIAIETAINGCLRLDSETAQQMSALEGRVVGVEIRGLDLQLYLLPGADSVQVLGQYEGEADTTLSGTPLSLARLGMAEQKADSLFSGDISLQGDTELGEQFQAILARVSIDWEEQLSRVTGDLAAHQIGNLSRQAKQFLHTSNNTLQQNISEYLQEESRLLPTRIEIENFLSDVDTLRLDGARLEARVRRLLALVQDQPAT